MIVIGGQGMEITEQFLLVALIQEAKIARVPVLGWPFECALAAIDEDEFSEPSAVTRCLRRWRRGRGGVSAKFLGIEGLLRDLARLGVLNPNGTGWDAGFSVADGPRSSSSAAVAQLALIDRKLIRQGAQRLRAAVRTWSKKDAASRPRGSVTMRSGSMR